MASKSYKATKGDEINLAIGAVVEVLQKSDNGWWLIRYDSNVKMAANGTLERKKGSSASSVVCLASRFSWSLSFIEQAQE